MFVLFCGYDLKKETRELLHAEFKQRTGEDCIILPQGATLGWIDVKNDRAASGERDCPERSDKPEPRAEKATGQS